MVPVTGPTAPSGNQEMGFGGNLLTTLLVGGLFSGVAAANQVTGAQTLRDLARTNSGLWESVSQSNRETLKTITETNTAASNDMTRWQVMGMIFNANTQYLQSVEMTNNMDRANRRAFFTERKQMHGESKMMTLAHNATIHADNLDQDRQMTQMEYDFQERVAAATTTTG
ncbi:MAG: hypothetical protein HY542_07545 [Deltaproteobacteria bacterium]|nr:hypothetical protein [Deltaproteobacteria bacterium]